MLNYFYFKENIYGNGTVIQVTEKYKEKFKFNLNVVFEKYDEKNELVYFRSLYNNWDNFSVTTDQLNECIDKVVEPRSIVIQTNSHKKIEEQYIDGIVSAWMLYIIVMFFGMFLKGALNVIVAWTLASVIFFRWRHNKINGG